MTKAPRGKTNSPKPTMGILESALERSIKHAVWLTPADEVSIEWAKKLARLLDLANDEPDVVRLGKLFETVTRDLGLSISGRDAKVVEPRIEVSPLDQIRQAAGGKSVTKNQNEVAQSKQSKPRGSRTS